jgi:hypothetical protein
MVEAGDRVLLGLHVFSAGRTCGVVGSTLK